MDLTEFLLSQRQTFEIGSWILGEAMENSLPCRFRVRSAKPLGVSTEEYACLLRVALHTSRELPDRVNPTALTEVRLEFEEVMEAMEERFRGAMMFAFYTEVGCEWFWYVADASSWTQDLIDALKHHPIYPIEVVQIEDHHWSIWEQLRFGNPLRP